MINIIDAMCGTGKTSAAINYINESDSEKSFIFITPYLEEANSVVPAKKHIDIEHNLMKNR